MGKGAIRFEVPQKKKYGAKLNRIHQAKANKQALQATRATQYREIPWKDMKQAISNASEMDIPPTLRRAKREKAPIGERVYVLDFDDDKIRCGIMNGTIPSTVMDSGCTSNVGKKNDPSKRTGVASNKVFILPNGQSIASTEMATYPFNLRSPANDVHITPGITSNSLLSTGKLADADYITVFDKEQVNVYDVNDINVTVTRGAIIRGWRDDTGLWRIPLLPTVRQDNVTNVNTETVLVNKPPTEFLANRPPPSEAVCNVYELKAQPELVRYYHAAAGFPTKPTWLQAIKNNHYASWTGLTYEGVSKYYPESNETNKGHGRKLKSGQRSTRKKRSTNNGIADHDELVPRSASIPTLRMEDGENFKLVDSDTAMPQPRERTIFTRIMHLDVDDEANEGLLQLIYTDGTGRFPKTSRTGMNYILVLVEIDSGAILVEAMRNRSAGEQCRAYQVLLDRLHKCKIYPKKHILDNEISNEFRAVIELNKMEHELVPPHDHRRNIAEKGIQTFKDHLIAIVCGTDKDFPLYLWADILPQAEHTLNLLRPSRRLPSVSAYAYLYGQHNYDKLPFAPLGCKVEAHMMPSTRNTWAEHTASGYYVGCSHEHYRCHKIYITSSRSIRVCQTVFFKHKYLTQPAFTSHDALIEAADKLASAITRVLPADNVTKNGVTALLDIFTQQANVAKDKIEEQRARQSKAASQRVQTETIVDNAAEQRVQAGRTAAAAEQRVTAAVTTATAPTPTFEYDDNAPSDGSPVITQDEDDEENDPPVERYTNKLRSRQTRSTTDEWLYSMMEFPGITTEVINSVTPRMAASRKYPMQFLCDFANAVIDDETGEVMEYRHLLKDPKHRKRWQTSFSKEIRRLATGTKTIKFVSKSTIPRDRWSDITYARIVCNERPEKKEPDRTRITMGGDRINYPGDCGTPTADILTVKLLLNSIISTLHAKFMTIDIKDFYLMTPMDRPEYFRMSLELFPDDIIDEYMLRDIIDAKGFIHCEVTRGMYGLPQAGMLAQDQLSKRLNKAGYHQSEMTPGYWKHQWRPISFALVVDDFGVKYVGEEHAKHLISVLQEHYEIDVDWDGTRFIGLTLDWDYSGHKVHLSMPGYIAKALARFAHPAPKKPQHQPHPHTERTYGATIQYAKAQDTSPVLPATDKTFIQQVLGVLLYYGRAVDSTVLVAIGSIASAQATPTAQTLELTRILLDYVATHPDAILTYEKSDMVVAVHSDASYSSEAGARSRAGGHFFMSSDVDDPPNNGAILNTSSIIKSVMSSAAEAELGALYINASQAVAIRQLLHEMGHKQPRTPIQTDNSTALGVVTNNIQPRRTKSMDMRFYWLRCRDAQGQFRYYWRPGPTNRADYYTKHHPASHHIEKRPTILTSKLIIDALRASTNRTPATKGKGLVATEA